MGESVCFLSIPSFLLKITPFCCRKSVKSGKEKREKLRREKTEKGKQKQESRSVLKAFSCYKLMSLVAANLIAAQRWGPVSINFQQATWPWNSNIGQRKWQETTQRRVKLLQWQRKTPIKWFNTDSNMASTSIHETTGFKIQTRDIHNPRGEPQKVKSLNFTKNWALSQKKRMANDFFKETVQIRTIATTATDMLECKKGGYFSIVCT